MTKTAYKIKQTNSLSEFKHKTGTKEYRKDRELSIATLVPKSAIERNMAQELAPRREGAWAFILTLPPGAPILDMSEETRVQKLSHSSKCP